MPSAFAQRIIEEVGPVDGYLHIDPVSLETPSTSASGKLSTVFRYDPWLHTTTKAMLDHHPVAVWRNLSVTIASRPGVYGRMVTLYAGWAPQDMPAPSTIREMRSLKGAVMKTVGGTGDPGMWSQNLPAPFDGSMSDVLKTRYNTGVRAVFYYAFTEQELTEKAPKTERFTLEFDGHYDVYGRF